MSKISVSLDKWRDYFSSADSDIFSIIEHAIMVAASDCPYDFKEKRDRIAELLFTCHRAELSVENGGGGGGGGEYKNGGGSKDSKESKVISHSRGDDEDDDHTEDDVETNVENRYDDAEALTDEIEEESQLLEEVARIRGILDEREEKSEEMLFDSLRRLQLMPLSVEVLKATEIGKSVNALRKHGSKEIRSLVKQLVEDWKEMVDAWVAATQAIADLTPESEKAPGVDNEDEEEEGLPSPPLDEGAFFANPASVEWSQFFDGMDDDGNLQNYEEPNKNQKNGRTRIPERTDVPPHKFESSNNSRSPPKESKPENRRNQESTMKKQSPPCKPNTPPVRPKPRPTPAMQRHANNIVRTKENIPIQRKPAPQQQEKSSRNIEASHRMKLEDAKRKLHERYQEAENAKKQRTIQVVELHDLPKQSLARGSQYMRRRW